MGLSCLFGEFLEEFFLRFVKEVFVEGGILVINVVLWVLFLYIIVVVLF